MNFSPPVVCPGQTDWLVVASLPVLGARHQLTEPTGPESVSGHKFNVRVIARYVVGYILSAAGRITEQGKNGPGGDPDAIFRSRTNDHRL